MVVALDIGTNNIRVVIADRDENGIYRILGTASSKSDGLRKGNIVNITSAAKAIKCAVEKAEQNAGVEIKSCYTAIGGDQIEGINTSGKVAVSPKGKYQREVAESDIKRVMESATAVQLSLDREILHVVTQEYIVDHVPGIKDPLHRIGVCLEANVHIITASSTTIQNIHSCIARAGYGINKVMLKTIACEKACVTAEEEERGSIVIDMGADSTDFIVMVDGSPIYTSSVPLGSNSLTHDIALIKGISFEEAERIKIESGVGSPEYVESGRKILIQGVGGRAPEEFLQGELCEILEARLEEIFEMVFHKISKNVSALQLSGNIVLTGGGANLDGAVEVAESVFRTTAVRVGQPIRLGGIEEDYAGPEWATAVGLAVAFKDEDFVENAVEKVPYAEKPKQKGVFKWILDELF